MEKCPSRFEDLPNELIMDICKYFDAREVFQYFYKLNFRFKKLLQSFDHLQLTVSLFDQDEKTNNEYLFIHIRTLIIDRGINRDLRYFPKLHHLILRNPKEKIFEQLHHHSIPHLEYLSITHKFLTHTLLPLINDLHRRIFSNHFPNLKSCNLSQMEVIMPVQTWQQSPSLCILKVGKINIVVYKAILSSCPYLYFFQLNKTQSNELSFDKILHSNLKQLVIKDEDQSFPWNDISIRDYLLCVPNLEKLTIHRTNSFKKMTTYFNYDWLSAIIHRSLLSLRQFDFILHVYNSKLLTKCYTENLFSSLKEHFIHLHKNQYQIIITERS